MVVVLASPTPLLPGFNHGSIFFCDTHFFHVLKFVSFRLQSLERVMSDQQKQLSDQLQKIERQQKQNNDLYAQLQKQVNSSH